MNKVILMGRLARDPEYRTTSNNVSVCTFTLAVDRRFKTAGGERQADFINIVAWRQTADFVSRYFKKGVRMAVVGSIQTRSYEDQNAQKRFVTEVLADEVYFADSKVQDNSSVNQSYSNHNNFSENLGGSLNNISDVNSSVSHVNTGYIEPKDDFFDNDTTLPFDF